MSHQASARFWRHFGSLPPKIQQLARDNFTLLKSNPRHPSLHFKRVGSYWSVRVGHSYRALGVQSPHGIVWFWIGQPEEYKRLIRGLPRPNKPQEPPRRRSLPRRFRASFSSNMLLSFCCRVVAPARLSGNDVGQPAILI